MNRTHASFLLALSLLFPLSAAAQRVTEDNDERVIFSLGNDIYAVGNLIDVDDPAPGDVNAAGNRIMIRNGIAGDLHAAGSDVTVNGLVEDDARIAAGDVTINGTVNGDVLAFGGNIYINKGATILGNLVAMGGRIVMDGAVRGNAVIKGGDVQLNGTVNGAADIQSDVLIFTGSVGSGAVIASKDIQMIPGPRIAGDLRYWQEKGAEDFDISVGGNVVYDEELGYTEEHGGEEAAGVFAAIFGAFAIYSLLFAALTIGLLMLATRTLFVDSAKHLQKRPGMSVLVGFLYFIVTPAIIIFLFITIIGIPLALVLLALYLISIGFAKILTAMVLARLLELRGKKKWHAAALFFASLGIYALLKILMIIPIVGWLVCIFTCMFAYGALLMAKKDRYMKVR
jgi:cytoskeletal protein CcmA (bactofilin family)